MRHSPNRLVSPLLLLVTSITHRFVNCRPQAVRQFVQQEVCLPCPVSLQYVRRRYTDHTTSSTDVQKSIQKYQLIVKNRTYILSKKKEKKRTYMNGAPSFAGLPFGRLVHHFPSTSRTQLFLSPGPAMELPSNRACFPKQICKCTSSTTKLYPQMLKRGFSVSVWRLQ